MQHLINKSEGTRRLEAGRERLFCDKPRLGFPILSERFLFFTSLLVWACFTTKTTNLLLIACFDIVHDVYSTPTIEEHLVSVWGHEAGRSGQTCDEIRAIFVLSYSTATPTGADLHKLERIIPKRCWVRCAMNCTNREIDGFLSLLGGTSSRLPTKARKKQSAEFQYSWTFTQRVIKKIHLLA